jgi:hypothetical protein
VRGSWLVLILASAWPLDALAAEASISVEAAGGCPDRADVMAGLEARLPGVTRPRRDPRPPQRYRLEVERQSSAAVALRLRDASGAPVLERRLAVPGAAQSAEGCQALAEAAALVVVRYLREIGFRSPTPVLPPDEPVVVAEPAPEAEPTPSPAVTTAPAPAPGSPSPPPAAGPSLGAAATVVEPVRSSRSAPASALFLGAGGAARVGLGGAATGQAPARSEVLLGLHGNRGWLAAEIAGGASTETAIDVPGSAAGGLRLRAFPLRAAVGIPLPLLGGVILPAVGASVDLLRFRAYGLVDARSGTRVEPSGELGLAYRAAGRRLFVRAALWGGFSLAPRDFDAGGTEPVFRTPIAHLRVVVEGGLSLWKN